MIKIPTDFTITQVFESVQFVRSVGKIYLETINQSIQPFRKNFLRR